MSVRRDRARTACRYLVSASGVPMIRYMGGTLLESPPPYTLMFTSARRKLNVLDMAEGLADDPKIAAAILYNAERESPDVALVGMTLRHFSALLGGHYASLERKDN